jgi:hypothetical protein
MQNGSKSAVYTERRLLISAPKPLRRSQYENSKRHQKGFFGDQPFKKTPYEGQNWELCAGARPHAYNRRSQSSSHVDLPHVRSIPPLY